MPAAPLLRLCAFVLLSACTSGGSGGGFGGGVAPDVARGASLPFGAVGKACDVSGAALGTPVDGAPSDSRPIWRLHDTAPGSTVPRTHYLTGFADGCARQVTAALILFGAPRVHETHKAGRAASSGPAAVYEEVRARICGATCSDARIEALSREVVFVSAYRDFSGSGPSYEILLGTDGVVAEGMRR